MPLLQTKIEAVYQLTGCCCDKSGADRDGNIFGNPCFNQLVISDEAQRNEKSQTLQRVGFFLYQK